MGISQESYLQSHKHKHSISAEMLKEDVKRNKGKHNISAELAREEIKKRYTVEVEGICACPRVIANSPMEALIMALRHSGYNVTKNNIRPIKAGTRTQLRVCKVCLLGGTRESVSYYELG